jgi:osmotically inducible protein OsmC
MKRIAKAVWTGGPRAGEGSVSTASGAFDNMVYAMGTSSSGAPCTNPCEMLAAAEAACVSIMVAKELNRSGIEAEFIQTLAELDLAQGDEGWHIPKIHLTVHACVDAEREAEFKQAVQRAKTECPITRSLKAEVTADAFVEKLPLTRSERVYL